MSSIDGLNMFGKLTMRSNNKMNVSFQTADENNDGFVDATEFRDMVNMYNSKNMDTTSFSSVAGEDNLITEEEWKIMTRKADFQVVLDEIDRLITQTDFIGADAYLQPIVAERLIECVNAQLSNPAFDIFDNDAVSDFRAGLKQDYQAIKESLEQYKPSVVKDSVIKEVQKEFPKTDRMSDEHKNLIDNEIIKVANNWVRENAQKYFKEGADIDSARDKFKEDLTKALKEHMNDEKLEELKKKAIQNEKNKIEGDQSEATRIKNDYDSTLGSIKSSINNLNETLNYWEGQGVDVTEYRNDLKNLSSSLPAEGALNSLYNDIINYRLPAEDGDSIEWATAAEEVRQALNRLRTNNAVLTLPQKDAELKNITTNIRNLSGTSPTGGGGTTTQNDKEKAKTALSEYYNRGVQGQITGTSLDKMKTNLISKISLLISQMAYKLKSAGIPQQKVNTAETATRNYYEQLINGKNSPFDGTCNYTKDGISYFVNQNYTAPKDNEIESFSCMGGFRIYDTGVIANKMINYMPDAIGILATGYTQGNTGGTFRTEG